MKTVPIKTIGHEKSSFTLVLACTASGQKLPPMIIFKRKTVPKEKFPPGIIVRGNKKGWMTEDMMKDWINTVYVKRPCLLCGRSWWILRCKESPPGVRFDEGTQNRFDKSSLEEEEFADCRHPRRSHKITSTIGHFHQQTV